MKKSYVFISLLFVCIHLFANTDSIPRGTVIYSIVKPEIFIPQNPTWMLLDGCDTSMSTKLYGSSDSSLIIFQSSLLHGDGIEVLPDARGLFIRGMNLGRSIDSGDANSDRKVGAYQKDEIQKHHHQYSDSRNSADAESDNSDERAASIQEDDITRQTEDAGTSTETRPRNITMYIYIKVN